MWPLVEAKRFHLGATLTAFHSGTYNRGDPLIAPVPLFSVRLDGVTLNLTYFPKVGTLNEIHTTALFFTFSLR